MLPGTAGDCSEDEVLLLGLPQGGCITLPDVHLAPPAALGGSQRPPSSQMAQKDALAQTAAAAGAALSAAAGLPPPQVPPGHGSSSFSFTMANNSSSKHFRYKWPDHPHLKFYPSVGHLHAGQAREVVVTFVAAAPVKVDNQDIKVALSQITYKVSYDSRAQQTFSVSALSCNIGDPCKATLPCSHC